MIESPGIGNLAPMLTLNRPAGEPLLLKVGSIVRARVIDVNEKGTVTLRLSGHSGAEGTPRGALLKAQSEVSLVKGQTIFLEIMGGKSAVTLRFMGEAPAPASPQQPIPAKILDLLAQLSASKMDSGEFQHLMNMLRSLPPTVKAGIPELATLEKHLLDIGRLDGKVLRAFVETSGVALETRLRIAALSDPGSFAQSLMALQSDGDIKALLLRLRQLLKDRNALSTLRQSGLNIGEIAQKTDRLLNHIEFLQLRSKIDDMFYTFLPALWDDLRDGELLFSRERKHGAETYTCDINLDTASMGKLCVSVTLMDSVFYISFSVERQDISDLILSQKELLEKRFTSQGLNLKALNVRQRDTITFGTPSRGGVHVRI